MALQPIPGAKPYVSERNFTNNTATGVRVFLRPNLYETNRANIVVLNWDLRENVAADISGRLPEGAGFEVRNAQDFFGPTVVTGRYDGRSISLPMKNLTFGRAVGIQSHPEPSWPQFNVFVLLPIQK